MLLMHPVQHFYLLTSSTATKILKLNWFRCFVKQMKLIVNEIKSAWKIQTRIQSSQLLWDGCCYKTFARINESKQCPCLFGSAVAKLSHHYYFKSKSCILNYRNCLMIKCWMKFKPYLMDGRAWLGRRIMRNKRDERDVFSPSLI